MHGFTGSADFILNGDGAGGTDVPQFDTIAQMDFNSDTTETCAFVLLPEGASATGKIKYSGTAIITGASYTTSFDGIVTGSVTFQGTGPLTSEVVA